MSRHGSAFPVGLGFDWSEEFSDGFQRRASSLIHGPNFESGVWKGIVDPEQTALYDAAVAEEIGELETLSQEPQGEQHEVSVIRGVRNARAQLLTFVREAKKVFFWFVETPPVFLLYVN